MTSTTFADPEDWYRNIFNHEEIKELYATTTKVLEEHADRDFEVDMIELPVLLEQGDVVEVLEGIKEIVSWETVEPPGSTFHQWLWGIAQALCVQYLVDDDWAPTEDMTGLMRYFGMRAVAMDDYVEDDDDEEDDDDDEIDDD